MQRRTLGTVLILLVMSALFLSGEPPSGAGTGIEGVIMISPAQPGPIRADSPGSIPLANVTFAIENEKGEVASFTTDDQGRFHTSLTPGHYKVVMKGRNRAIGRFGPFEVDVVAGKMTNVQWECDSGIR
jgi:Prealbumin-like fold domain